MRTIAVDNHGVVLETGRIRFMDTAEALRENPVVQHAYLGIA
ncbi:MAG: hypothetical protein QHH80_06320 [Anaerolineae bacterium]|jgi:ABC-type branched-subunit amino acid transport system ATPase component|nr:hypothetical protein [Anaerolineae bacterium]